MDPFKDKIAIVTGGASGIGRAVCEELGRRGAVVTVADLDADGTAQVVSDLTSAGGRARASHLDVSREEAVSKLIEDVATEHGRLDYIFNIAGIGIGGEVRDMRLEDWRPIIDVNLYGVLYGTLTAYQIMIGQGFGHIVNMASTYGLVPAPGEAAYGTTKHAVVGLSLSLRTEAEDLGVKVSVICPGFVDTAIWKTSPILNVDRDEALSKLPFRMMSTVKAAKTILRGVARNRAIIVFPLHARITWWIHRLCPSLIAPIGRKAIRNFWAIRSEPKNEDIRPR